MAEPSDANASRRLAILEAAVGVFSRYGFKKASMDDLARAAGLSRQGLYLHFSTKEALFKDALLRFVETMRAAGRAALAREDATVEERLLGMYEALHGHLVGTADAANMNELLEVATQLVGPIVTEFEAGLTADVARVLRSAGVANAWKDEGLTAKDLADNLCSTSEGVKHRVATQADYRERMKVAIAIVCSRKGREAAR